VQRFGVGENGQVIGVNGVEVEVCVDSEGGRDEETGILAREFKLLVDFGLCELHLDLLLELHQLGLNLWVGLLRGPFTRAMMFPLDALSSTTITLCLLLTVPLLYLEKSWLSCSY
jgi:hypothetical protein